MIHHPLSEMSPTMRSWMEENKARHAAESVETRYGADLTDYQVAFKLASLMRNDLDHEGVLTLGKERIRWLAVHLALEQERSKKLTAALAALVDCIDETRGRDALSALTTARELIGLPGTLP